MKHTLYLIACGVIMGACGLQEKNMDTKITRYEHILDSLRNQYQIPGISVGIAWNDSIIYAKGLGLADVENNIPMTANTPLRIASITKPIFSTVFFKLVEEGKIDLNWKIKDYYPDYIGSCERILQYFKADMPEYAFLLDHYEPQRNDILLQHHLSHTAENIPGTAYKYNGFLFGMLSDVVETATNKTFDTWIDSLIIQKLQLQNSASSQLDSSKIEVLDRVAFPYQVNENGSFEKVAFPDLALNAGAGLVFSASDLLRYDKALNQNMLVSEASKNQMFTPFKLADNSISPYGYGWFIQKYKGNTLLWHNGWQPNAYSGLYLKVVEQNLTLVLLANGENLSAPFAADLGNGNVLNTAFAKAFLALFLEEN